MKDRVNLHNCMPLKSIAFTKFDIAHMLLKVKAQMTACSKERRTWFKISPKLYYNFSILQNIKYKNYIDLNFIKYFEKSH